MSYEMILIKQEFKKKKKGKLHGKRGKGVVKASDFTLL